MPCWTTSGKLSWGFELVELVRPYNWQAGLHKVKLVGSLTWLPGLHTFWLRCPGLWSQLNLELAEERIHVGGCNVRHHFARPTGSAVLDTGVVSFSGV